MRVEDVQYVLDELGSGGYRRSGDHLMAQCPLAPWLHASGKDKNPSFGVLITEGMSPCNCFTPGCFPMDGPGTLFNAVKEVGRRKIKDGEWQREQLDELLSFIMLAEDEEVSDDWGKDVTVLPIPPEILDALGSGSPYWEKRGVSAETSREWRLGEVGNRALIPFLDRYGEIVAVQGRLVGEKRDDFAFDRLIGSKGHEEKYRTWPVGFSREDHVAGEHLLKKPVQFLLVVESPVDALLLNDWLRDAPDGVLPDGDWAVVSTMGGKVASRQLQIIVESVRGELALGFDMDNPGKLATKKVVDALKRRLSAISIVEWRRNDPSDRGDPPVSVDQLKKDAYRSIRERSNWFADALESRLKRAS